MVESACNVVCDTGYKADNFEEVTATCVTPGSEFMLHGCYLDNSDFKDDEPNFIRLKNALWLDAGNGVVETDGKVSSWTSRLIKIVRQLLLLNTQTEQGLLIAHHQQI